MQRNFTREKRQMFFSESFKVHQKQKKNVKAHTEKNINTKV